jgi:hypothetical protein
MLIGRARWRRMCHVDVVSAYTTTIMQTTAIIQCVITVKGVVGVNNGIGMDLLNVVGSTWSEPR